jgi:hypothetical protein
VLKIGEKRREEILLQRIEPLFPRTTKFATKPTVNWQQVLQSPTLLQRWSGVSMSQDHTGLQSHLKKRKNWVTLRLFLSVVSGFHVGHVRSKQVRFGFATFLFHSLSSVCPAHFWDSTNIFLSLFFFLAEEEWTTWRESRTCWRKLTARNFFKSSPTEKWTGKSS